MDACCWQQCLQPALLLSVSGGISSGGSSCSRRLLVRVQGVFVSVRRQQLVSERAHPPRLVRRQSSSLCPASLYVSLFVLIAD